MVWKTSQSAQLLAKAEVKHTFTHINSPVGTVFSWRNMKSICLTLPVFWKDYVCIVIDQENQLPLPFRVICRVNLLPLTR